MAQRQRQVEPFLPTLKACGLRQAYAPTTLQALIEQSRQASGQYSYQQGQFFLPQAQAGDKSAARKGYGWMGRAVNYMPERTSEFQPLWDELFDLATTRVVIEMIEPIRPRSKDHIVYDLPILLYSKERLAHYGQP